MFKNFPLGVIRSETPAHAPSLQAHAISSMKAPAQLVRHGLFQPCMYLNDKLGTCAEAALAHVIRAQAALQKWDVGIADSQIEALYSAAGGYVPGRPETDQGTDLVRLLTYQIEVGFQTTADTYDGLWASLDHTNLNLGRVVMAEFGSVYAAVDLAEADQVGGGVWRLNTPASYGDPKAGSWGPHCVQILGYTGLTDNDLVTITTWGLFQTATWAWVQDRLYQAFLLYHPQMLGPDGRNPAGLDRDRLAADVASFGVTI